MQTVAIESSNNVIDLEDGSPDVTDGREMSGRGERAPTLLFPVQAAMRQRRDGK